MTMRPANARILLIPSCVVFLILSCNLNAAADLTAPATVTPYQMAAAGETVTATLLPTDALSPTDTSTPTATASVVHVTTPGNPGGTTRYITDPVTTDYAPQRRAPSGSDNYQINRYERPYTAGTMQYLADVDLTRAEMSVAPPWIYITFSPAGTRQDGIGQTEYGVELDTNRDGRGEYLIWGLSPAGTGWTTDGVEIWKDTNADVGGARPQLSDAPVAGNGYDQLVFSSGRGDDPDLAWIRRAIDGTRVQLAFKSQAIGTPSAFLWNAIADGGVRRPDGFDYNDHFTQADAGSPLPSQADLYPLKDLFGVDNTCRDAYGFLPAGTETGLCEYPGSLSGRLCWDIDHDGACNATELTIALIAGDQITLGPGACPAAVTQTMNTDSEGRYSFANLAAGSYCLGYIHVPAPGLLINPNPMTVTILPGEAKTVNLSIPW